MSQPHRNIYHNPLTGATSNPLMTDPDSVDEAFAEGANQVLIRAAEIARQLIGAHQAAVAIIVQGDWTSVRKYFSLSEKYSAWKDYATPATGYGIHDWILQQDAPVRMTQAELEAHPGWKNFGTEQGKHPPMRGWLAAPLRDAQGVNWGVFQLSDKYDGDFSAEDQDQFMRLVELTAISLEALWQVRNLQKATRA
ncbi:MAG: GAF domain-containing protein [bacterium]|nr:GAF domain-containing protein [bacterium]